MLIGCPPMAERQK